MPVVYNPTEEFVHTQLKGSWFAFKPGGTKIMDAHMCQFIKELRKGTGLTVLSDKFDPNSDAYIEGYKNTEEGQAELLAAKQEGIANLIAHHMEVVKNNQVSLRKDLAISNPSGDPQRLAALEASPGEIASMKLVSKYQKLKLDTKGQQVAEIEKLMQDIGTID